MADEGIKPLEPYAIIGFDGSALKSLKAHPDGEHIAYPMGNKVCLQHWKTKQMHFLSGHTNTVVCVNISPKGRFIGSGQINHIGFKSSTILWDFNKRMRLSTHDLHKVRVEALMFTSDERYMVSIGGRDDGHIVVWDCESMSACSTACTAQLTAGDAFCISPLLRRCNSFVTGGDGNLRIWNLTPATKTLEFANVTLGKLRRSVKCIAVSADDAFGYAGTTSGDIIKFTIGYPEDANISPAAIKPAMVGCYAKCGTWKKNSKRPQSQCYAQGVQEIIILKDGCLIVGGGDGTIDVLDEINWSGQFTKGKLVQPNIPFFKALKTIKLDGCITSLDMYDYPTAKQKFLLAGTRTSEVYAINLATFNPTLVVTCHRCSVNDICFPPRMSDVFATAGSDDIRVWSLQTAQELLRIMVPNFVCSAVLFTHDGKSIVSAWSDSCIRAFTPLTGRLIYCILNTHNKGTSALSITTDGKTLISGGCEGQVRIWDIKPSIQSLKKVLKEHKSPVSAIQVCPSDNEAVSAGTDGSCIIWDIIGLSRRQVLYANTLFTNVCYEPSGCQLLTAGSDRRVSYWEAGSGNLARELEASKTGAINGLHITADGSLFVTGSNDQMVKLWLYEEGIYTHLGMGHSGAVTSCRFSPNGRYIVSSCSAGSIIVWKMPEQYIKLPTANHKVEAAQIKEDLSLPIKEEIIQKKSSKTSLRKASPKEEKIQSIDTARDSIHICECTCGSGPASKRSDATGDAPKVCVPLDSMPTKTTSKTSVAASRK